METGLETDSYGLVLPISYFKISTFQPNLLCSSSFKLIRSEWVRVMKDVNYTLHTISLLNTNKQHILFLLLDIQNYSWFCRLWTVILTGTSDLACTLYVNVIVFTRYLHHNITTGSRCVCGGGGTLMTEIYDYLCPKRFFGVSCLSSLLTYISV